MKLPHVIASGLTKHHAEKWKSQFVDNDRAIFESIWRRTQDKTNADLSGWKSPQDMRRRMLHFYDKYDVVPDGDGYALQLFAPYLWISFAFPEAKIVEYRKKINEALQMGGWTSSEGGGDRYKRGDIVVTIKDPGTYPSDISSNRTFPAGYTLLDVELTSKYTSITDERKHHPWEVLDTGIRTKDKRGDPHVVSTLKELEKYFPMQLELGCGPSIEVGIPPLHYLHRIYAVSDPETHRFILDPKADSLILDIFKDPEDFYKRSSLPYLRSIVAEPNDFFLLLREMRDRHMLVGDVITNNFDGLPSLVGLAERYVRHYADVDIVPHIDFHQDARTLLVIGAHADRRRIQASARERGMRIIYVDPEGYFEDGKFMDYPLESPQNEDMLIHLTAGEFTKAFRETFPRE